MAKILISNQEEFDRIKIIQYDDEVIFESNSILVNCVLEVYGILRLKGNNYCDRSNNRYILLKGNGQVHSVSWDSSQVHSECYNYSIIFANRLASLYIRGYSVALLPDDFVIKINKEDTCVVQRYKVQESFFERNRVKVENGVCVLYKKVSKKYKTQEDTRNETVWTIGSIVEYKQWEPTGSECGEGKFHACSRPYFCDEFRNNVGDKYIAIEVRMENVYEWKNPEYPHKIGFRKGLVVYECDKYGNKKEGYCE